MIKQTVFPLFFLFAVFSMTAQEVCDNGVDDNGNGLIDLYDPACICEGIGVEENDVTYKVPNPDFEQMDCCPDFISQVTECLTSWVAPTTATPDYLHTCDFMFAAVYEAGLYPFPSGGEGIAGASAANNWREYIGACLNGTLEAGVPHQFSIQIAFAPVLMSQQQGYPLCPNPPGYPPIFMSVYGNSSCNKFNMNGTTCPPSLDGSWIELGTVIYVPESQWGLLTISFTPSQDINAIIFGAACDIPPEYVNPPCSPYFFLDDIGLVELIASGELDIDSSGDLCAGDLSLSAWADPPGGEFQWYFNGAAIPGETADVLLLPPATYEPGTYTVRYSLNGECMLDSIALSWVLPEPSEEEVFVCIGETATCAGEQFQDPGEYEVVLNSWLGCDSIVTCSINHYPAVPITSLTIDVCGPAMVTTCGDVFSQSGLYTTICDDQFGCDSIVELTLNILQPMAIITTPDFLGCDTTVGVFLDGSLSPLNPSPGGLTQYEWTGPTGGIKGLNTGPTVQVTLPGNYCLEVFHVNGGATCSHVACIEVIQLAEEPALPALAGPNARCTGSPIQFNVLSGGGVAPTGFNWIYSSGLSLLADQDTSIIVLSAIPGMHSICVVAYNECGVSDTICQFLELYAPDTVIQTYSTCDPGMIGISEEHFQNQQGCDSLIITTVTLSPSDITYLSLSTCDPSLAGMDTVYLVNQNGCDSILFREIVFSSSHSENQTIIICSAGSNFSDTLFVSGGPCDSLFITDYQYVAPDSTWLTDTTCDAAMAGIFTTVLQNQSGCDSTIVTTISLLPRDTNHISGTTCDIAQASQDTLTLVNQYGCDSTVIQTILYMGVDTQYVQVYSCDSAQVGTTVSLLSGMYCDTVRVTNTQWSPFSQSTETIYSCDPAGPATDTTYLTASSGCDSLHIRQYEYTLLDATLTIDHERCAGQHNGIIEVQQVTGGLAPYTFSLNGGNSQSDPIFDDLAPGTYTVAVQDDRGCIRTFPGSLIQSGQTVQVDIGPDQTTVLGAMIDLSVQANALLDQILWTAFDPLACATCPVTTLGPITTAQTVTVQVISVDGCPGNDALQLTLQSVEPELKDLYIPNSFSPNGDGINDLFTIYGNASISFVRNLAIYDRWGNALYFREDLNINDPSQGWDGLFRGKIMDPGVYVYFFEVVFADGSERLYKGDVTLVR
ncbi:MAG: gliding motility-associated C-terminal domain-containing protein [Saprospiraceae bacterium]|nr:gliding motility-associated C-terminal domain-containing protein [Saprospiraceae bacterium]